MIFTWGSVILQVYNNCEGGSSLPINILTTPFSIMSDVNLAAHKKGDTWMGLNPVTFQINGEPVDITDAVIRMQARAKACGVVLNGEWTTEDGSIIITDALGGEFTVEPRIINWAAGTYYYDIEVMLSGGRVMTIVEGSWEITQDITR